MPAPSTCGLRPHPSRAPERTSESRAQNHPDHPLDRHRPRPTRIGRACATPSWWLTSNEFLMGLDRSTAVWVIEPDLTLETESAGMGIPLRGR